MGLPPPTLVVLTTDENLIKRLNGKGWPSPSQLIRRYEEEERRSDSSHLFSNKKN